MTTQNSSPAVTLDLEAAEDERVRNIQLVRYYSGSDWGCAHDDSDEERWLERMRRALALAYPGAEVEVEVAAYGPSYADVTHRDGMGESQTERDVLDVGESEWEEFCAADFDA